MSDLEIPPGDAGYQIFCARMRERHLADQEDWQRQQKITEAQEASVSQIPPAEKTPAQIFADLPDRI